MMNKEQTEQAKKLLHLFICYGTIHTIKGVSYPQGTHEEVIKEATELLSELKNETT